MSLAATLATGQELKADPARHREYLDWIREHRRQRRKQR
ncbi:protein of unknown function [Methylocaldum szegediense]|uniref:Uncharacterized protein n=1 Tax=Methylocaldum szegediense TaxID=73780 RepID=A0ABM9HYF1_9GAMM|nr:protein of unknown function [Methylocaldum szegediense]